MKSQNHFPLDCKIRPLPPKDHQLGQSSQPPQQLGPWQVFVNLLFCVILFKLKLSIALSHSSCRGASAIDPTGLVLDTRKNEIMPALVHWRERHGVIPLSGWESLSNVELLQSLLRIKLLHEFWRICVLLDRRYCATRTSDCSDSHWRHLIGSRV